jgi:hypothetical protein
MKHAAPSGSRAGRRRRWPIIGCIVLAAAGVAALLLFPGQRLGLAFTLATGIGTRDLQRRIDALEDQAISHKALAYAEWDE